MNSVNKCKRKEEGKVCKEKMKSYKLRGGIN